MKDEISFDRSVIEPTGQAITISPLVRRLVAPNGGPFTFTGTCTYLVGQGDVAVIDPGPELDAHLDALITAIGTARVSAIVVTHTHKDHSPLSRRLKALTGAPLIGCGPHQAARELGEGETNMLDASADHDHMPDRLMQDGEEFEGEGRIVQGFQFIRSQVKNALCEGRMSDSQLIRSAADDTAFVLSADVRLTAQVEGVDPLG